MKVIQILGIAFVKNKSFADMSVKYYYQYELNSLKNIRVISINSKVLTFSF